MFDVFPQGGNTVDGFHWAVASDETLFGVNRLRHTKQGLSLDYITIVLLHGCPLLFIFGNTPTG